MMSTKPSRQPQIWRNLPYLKDSPRKVVHRGPSIYARPDGTQFSTTKNYLTQGEVPALVPTPISQSSSQTFFKGELTDIFLMKNIDLRGTKKIGGGRYSKVYRAEKMNMDGTQIKIAMKVIDETKHSKEYVKKFLPREVDCWKRLEHPHIVRLLGHYSGRGHTFLTMEYAERGDLLRYVQMHGGASEERAKVWVYQIVKAVGYIHTMGMAHRDLKLENIMIFHERVVKVGDFGFIKSVGHRLSTTHCGSKSYSAPEILSGEEYNPYKAVGMIVFIMVANQMPFREDQPNSRIIEIQKKKLYPFPIEPAMSDECKRLILQMLQYQPVDRPRKMTDVLKDPWFY